MFMRTTRFTPVTPMDDARIVEGGERLAAAFGQMPGYFGWSALYDRASGQAASVTYWADAESLRASEEVGNAARARVVSEGAEIRSVQRAERLISERGAAPRTGVLARVTTFSIAPERIDELISHMNQVTVPQVRATSGFQAFLVNANRETGEIGVASIWDSAASREASMAALSDERQQTMDRFEATVESVESYEVVAVDVKLPTPT
jgi:heme-degrading monooxygenase HmoA